MSFAGKNWISRMLVGRKEILQLSLNQEVGEDLKTFKWKERLEEPLNLHAEGKYVLRPSQEIHMLRCIASPGCYEMILWYIVSHDHLTTRSGV